MLGTPEPEVDRRKQTVAIVTALAVTAAIAAFALYLGGWAYEGRSHAMHRRRLEGLLAAKPHVSQVTAAFEAEDTRPLAVARSSDELRAAADRWGGRRRDEILAEGARRRSTRIFAAGDFRYFLYFDERGVLSGFTLATE